ncbi:hypothetical protein R6242_18935 [Iodobacter sp. CM08]|uniref:hypothetical protein n=1 Tax=Iodobacter sp. CM08 TaxID=3085902 RepID=UPI002982497A|nr:hypothetical protein [Iodobacter sp. CM08]MDW5418645.1 hypothetical protein [Iodobacter sp. CM08]
MSRSNIDVVLFPVVHDSYKGWGAYSNEGLKWIKIASNKKSEIDSLENYSASLDQWRERSRSEGIGDPIPYVIPLTPLLRDLTGNGKVTAGPQMTIAAHKLASRMDGDDLACVAIFNAQKDDTQTKRTKDLSAPLRDVLFNFFSGMMSAAPLMLAVGEGWYANSRGITNDENITLALNIAREANTLSLHCLSRTFWQCLSIRKDNSQEANIAFKNHYDRWFCRIHIKCIIGDDDPLSADFYVFACDSSIEETVSECLSDIKNHLIKTSMDQSKSSGFKCNFL